MILNISDFYDGFLKSIAESSKVGHYHEDDLALVLLEAHPSTQSVITLNAPTDCIQFFFAPGDEILFEFSPTYSQTLGADMYFLLYFPNKSLTTRITLTRGQQLACLFISLEKLHQLFVYDLESLHFLEGEQITRAFKESDSIQADLKMVLTGCFQTSRIPSHRHLFFKAKTYEILSHFFSQRKHDDQEACPFLESEGSVAKIRMAKKIVSHRLYDPPSLVELSNLVDLNEYQLKAGFKKIFGASVFEYIQDQKMIQAKKMLDSGTMRVKEVSTRVGYSSPSHFIVAFKRSFGITPKKYLLSRNANLSNIPHND